MAALAVSKHRDDYLRKHHQRRVHFKTPMVEEDPTAEDDSMASASIEEESVISSRKNNSMKTRMKERIDPIFQMHAKEVIACKLREGYYLKGNGEKCKECFMPLMVKDSAWDGVFCGQGWYQSSKRGVCVVCNPDSNSIMDSDDDDDESYESMDLFVKRGIHWIPGLPEDEQSQVGSRDAQSCDGSVDDFQKKISAHAENHVNKDELDHEEVQDAVVLNDPCTAIQSGDSKHCQECGMEMLDFGDHMECPFCALEVVKKELGIAATDPVAEPNAEPQSEDGSEPGAGAESNTEPAADKTENVQEKIGNTGTNATEKDGIEAKEDTVEQSRHVDDAKKKSNKKDDESVEGLYVEDLKAQSSSCSTLSASVRFAEVHPISPTAPDCSAPEKSATTQNECEEARAKAPSSAGTTQLAVNSILKKLITGFWQDNNQKSSQNSVSMNEQSPNNREKLTEESKSMFRELQERVKSLTVAEDPEANALETDPAKEPEDVDLDFDCSNDFLHVERTLFDEDMSTNEIISALSEINSVTRSLLTKQVPAINPIPEHMPLIEEEPIRSRIDPPSVCSRDPPHLAINTDELRGDSLLLRNDHVSPDSRDPPTTVPDMNYQNMSEFSFQDNILECAVPDRAPRDPSEHGGSIDMDSFSQVDESDSVPVYQSNPVEEVLAKYENTRTSTQNMVSSTSVKASLENNSKATTTKILCQQPDIRSAAVSQKLESQRAVEVTPLRAADLYQQPAFLTKAARDEPESSRDAMVRSRLMQLESRYQKLTSSEASPEAGRPQLSAPVVRLNPNTDSIFRKSQFSFDNVDLHRTTSISDTWKVKDNGPVLSQTAIQRREQYKKELFDKARLKSQNSNNTAPCLSSTALERRKHYKEVLRRQMSEQASQVASQE